MSYYNVIEIDRDEYYSMKRKAKERESLKRRLNKERERRKRDRDRLERNIEKINREFSSKVEALNKENKKLNNNLETLNRELLNTKKEYKRKFDSLDSKIDATKSQLQDEISFLRKETKEEIKKQKERIDTLIKHLEIEKSTKKEMALEWLHNLETQIDMISKLQHEKFKPSALSTLLKQAELAKDNIKNGIFESAIASLQERFIDAQKLFAEIYLLQKEFEELQQIALDNIKDLYSLLEAQKIVEYEIEEDIIEVDVNYWTEGGIDSLKAQIKELEDKITDDNTTTQELIDIISIQNQLFEDIKNIADKAKDNLLLSQVRIDNGNDIIDILDEMGFSSVDDTFDRDDQRKSLFVKFENDAKEEILIVLSPDGSKNKLNIMFDIDSTNVKMKDIRLNNIINRLKEKGIETNNFKCTDSETPTYEIEKYKNFDKIRKGEVDTKTL